MEGRSEKQNRWNDEKFDIVFIVDQLQGYTLGIEKNKYTLNLQVRKQLAIQYPQSYNVVFE